MRKSRILEAHAIAQHEHSRSLRAARRSPEDFFGEQKALSCHLDSDWRSGAVSTRSLAIGSLAEGVPARFCANGYLLRVGSVLVSSLDFSQGPLYCVGNLLFRYPGAGRHLRQSEVDDVRLRGGDVCHAALLEQRRPLLEPLPSSPRPKRPPRASSRDVESSEVAASRRRV